MYSGKFFNRIVRLGLNAELLDEVAEALILR